jgi:hypothetical protein
MRVDFTFGCRHEFMLQDGGHAFGVWEGYFAFLLGISHALLLFVLDGFKTLM